MKERKRWEYLQVILSMQGSQTRPGCCVPMKQAGVRFAQLMSDGYQLLREIRSWTRVTAHTLQGSLRDEQHLCVVNSQPDKSSSKNVENLFEVREQCLLNVILVWVFSADSWELLQCMMALAVCPSPS